MKKKFSVTILMSMLVMAFCCGVPGYADDSMDDSQQRIEDEKTIATLKNDIRLLDVEIEKCEKQKKGWTVATVIGGVGVVSTGIAAGVQGAKLKEQKQQINLKQQELSDLEAGAQIKRWQTQ